MHSLNFFLWIADKQICFGGFCTCVNQIESFYWDHRQRPAQAPNPWWKYIIRTQMNAPLGSKLSAPVDFISLFTLSFQEIIFSDKNNRKWMIWHTPIWLQNQHICKISETNFGFRISWIGWKWINFTWPWKQSKSLTKDSIRNQQCTNIPLLVKWSARWEHDSNVVRMLMFWSQQAKNLDNIFV